jgi:polyhydroxyalkanoate synthase
LRFECGAIAAFRFANELGFSMFESMAGLLAPPEELMRIQKDYLDSMSALWGSACKGFSSGAAVSPAPEPLSSSSLPLLPDLSADRRFAGADWLTNPFAAYSAAFYLLNAKALTQMADALQGDEKTRQRVRFAVQQWVDAMSPSNYLALNPEAQRKAIETKGESLTTGALHLMRDLQQGHVSQTDESLFEVGRNVAVTEGAVVFENEFFQLIEYKPLTPKVHERPLLIVPPCINKFYILDLQPENSLVRYCLEQGQRVFLVSWVNPNESLAQATWDDYVQQGAVRAIEQVLAITRQKQLNMLGFCIGGTIVCMALALLAAQGKKPVSSLTLLTAMLDFSNTGILDIFVDEALVQMRDMTIGEASPRGGNLLKGRELASTFSFLRPNDLVWNYVVGNYLKGETPPAFDLLYWNSDSANLPGPMYCWYLRHTYLQNELRTPGALSIAGYPIDLTRLDMPVYLYGSREDHIVPWESAYASTLLLPGQKRFVLGASGHIAGVINPPAKKKRNYWVNDDLSVTAQEWLAGATSFPGSWWSDWVAWLLPHAGKKVAAPKQYGDTQHPAIEPAPGRYVNVKA